MMFSNVKVQLCESLTQQNQVPHNLIQQWVQSGSLESSVNIEEDNWISCGSLSKAVKLHDLLASVYGATGKLKSGDSTVTSKSQLLTSPNKGARLSRSQVSATFGTVNTADLGLPHVSTTSLDGTLLSLAPEPSEFATIKQDITDVGNDDYGDDDIFDELLEAARHAEDGNEYRDPVKELEKGKALLDEYNSNLPRLACPHCDFVVMGRNNLDKHIKSDHEGKGYDCQHCSKIFSTTHLRERHAKKLHNIYRCRKCELDFSEDVLKTHKPKCPGKPNVCEQCFKVFSDIKGLRKHVISLHGDNVKCKYCDQCLLPFSMAEHLKKVHDIWECRRPGCKFTTSGKEEWVQHTLEKHNVQISDKWLERLTYKTKVPLVNESTGYKDIDKVKGKPEVNCPYCNIRLNESNLQRHIEQIHGKQALKYKCDYCDKKYIEKSVRDAHAKRVHKKFKCIKCCEVFDDYDESKAHKLSCTGKPNECPICHKVIKGNRYSLNMHISRMHEETAHICDLCGKQVKAASMNDHLKRQHDIWHCSWKGRGMCSFTGNSKDEWVQHMENTHGETEQGLKKRLERVKKIVCTKRAPRRAQRKLKPRTCEICGKTCATSTRLKIHMENNHFKKNIPCEVCQKVFPSKYQVHEHMRKVHSATKRTKEPTVYSCSVCQKQFYTGRMLATHTQKIHGFILTDNSYPCDICNKLFYSDITLRDHKQRKHGEGKLFHCGHDNCGKSFSTKGRLQIHMKVAHEGEKMKSETGENEGVTTTQANIPIVPQNRSSMTALAESTVEAKEKKGLSTGAGSATLMVVHNPDDSIKFVLVSK